MTRHKVKIAVLKTFDPKVVFKKTPINTETGKPHIACPIHKEGQTFIAERTSTPPEGFCPNAWHDIKEYVSVLHQGGTYYPWLAENGMIRCCTDGIRPVVFRLERMETVA
jgi:uncharacterized repeat protein (TIGR04076 family)